MDLRELRIIDEKYMPSVIWDWCAKPKPEEIDASLYSFSQMGIKRVFLRPSKGLVTAYLSEEFFELVRTAARRSARYSLELWLYDENSDSSGSGGGEIISVPDYRLREVVLATENGIEKSDIVLGQKGDKSLLLRDSSQIVSLGRKATADITSPFISECFFDEVYGAYFHNCARFIGHEIGGFLTQIKLPEGAVFYKNAANELSVSEDSLAEALISENCESEAIRTLYYEKVNASLAESFTKPLFELCHKNSLSLSVSTEGASYISRQYNYSLSDFPSLSVCSDNLNFTEIKLLTSVCEQFSKSSFLKLKTPSFSKAVQRCNSALFLASMGATSICFESVAFSLSDRRKYEQYTTVLSAAEKEISSLTARMCQISNGTKSNCNILLVYPFPQISERAQKELEKLTQALISAGITFHISDEYMLSAYGKAENGKLTIGEQSYEKVLVLGDAPLLEKTTILIKNSGAEIYSVNGENKSLPSALKISYSQIPDSLSSSKLLIVSEEKLYISRRFDGDDEYAFITAPDSSAAVSVSSTENIYTVDITDGEVYLLPTENNTATFTVMQGKTCVILSSSHISADSAPPLTGEIEITPYERVTTLPFVLASAQDNILPLKEVNACFGKKSYRNENIDNLHKVFYALKDGETVKVKYPFNVAKKPGGQIFAYIENADAFDMLSLNGKPLPPLTPHKSDSRFLGCDITNLLSEGKNTLALEYKKYNNYTPGFESRTPSYYRVYTPTSFEPVYLCGDFDCDANTLYSSSDYGSDVTQCGMPYYYGPLEYAVKLPENNLHNTILTVKGNFDLCKIKIGKREKLFFSEVPIMELFEIDSLAVAEITIYNTPHNLFREKSKQPHSFGIESVTTEKLQ